jgi:hypothetical protein
MFAQLLVTAIVEEDRLARLFASGNPLNYGKPDIVLPLRSDSAIDGFEDRMLRDPNSWQCKEPSETQRMPKFKVIAFYHSFSPHLIANKLLRHSADFRYQTRHENVVVEFHS